MPVWKRERSEDLVSATLTEKRGDAAAALAALGDDSALLQMALENMLTATGPDGAATDLGHAANIGKGRSTA